MTRPVADSQNTRVHIAFYPHIPGHNRKQNPPVITHARTGCKHMISPVNHVLGICLRQARFVCKRIRQRKAVVGRGIILRIAVPAVVYVVHRPIIHGLDSGVGILSRIGCCKGFQHLIQFHIPGFLRIELFRVEQLLHRIHAHSVAHGARAAYRHQRKTHNNRQQKRYCPVALFLHTVLLP